jgi:hypothetical protein
MGIATHEFGHSHGLSHTLNNQISAADPKGSTMFPIIDTGDPATEFSLRSLEIDDIAWSSFIYPEGTGTSGPAALQPGDVAFGKAFGLITGQVWHRFPGQPIAGASVSAMDLDTGAIVSSAFSGTTQLSFNPVTNQLFVTANLPFHIRDGRYTMPVPKGNYAVGVEPVDGSPVSTGSISSTASIGGFFGQQTFNEEYYNKNSEANIELRSGQASTVHVNQGQVQSDIDITTGRSINVNMFGNRNFIGFTAIPPGFYYAVRIPAATIAAVNPGEEILVKAIAFDTLVFNASVAPVFAQAMLTTGTVNADGSIATVNLTSPLETVTGFLGQDDDFSPFHFKNPQELGRRVRRGIDQGDIQNLFLVLRVPTASPFPGIDALPPLIWLDGGVAANDVPIFGLSYTSNDGLAFDRDPRFNFRFSLVLSEPVVPGNPFVQTFNISNVACDGLDLDGVQYRFAIGGSPSGDCRAGSLNGPTMVTNNIQAPHIEGNALGVLGLIFDAPTSEFAFGIATNTTVSPQPQSVIVDLFSPGAGTFRQELTLTTTRDVNFVGGHFEYRGPAIKSASIRFSGTFARFLVDAVTYQRPGH